jgi:hypothetical protein
MRNLQTPKDKYMNDPEYHHLVQTLTQMIHQARFTPAELREACVLASINYEMTHIRDHHINPKLENAFMILDEFVSKSKNKRG